MDKPLALVTAPFRGSGLERLQALCSGIVLDLRGPHIGEVELVDLLARCVHADKRRTIQGRTRCRHREQRRQSGIAVQCQRERREIRLAELADGAAGDPTKCAVQINAEIADLTPALLLCI